MADLIITIDGPAASGKSTVARRLAERLGASFLDTGAMYRAVTLAAMQADVDMNDEDELLSVLDNREFEFAIKEGKMAVRIDGVDVTEQIRGAEVTANARYVASAAKIREKLVQMQRQVAAKEGKIVTEGRDQGTLAFPDADIKFYLTAKPIERARRRQEQLRTKGGGEDEGSLQKIQRAIEERDKSDSNRAVGPLRKASDAVVIDTTDLSLNEVVEKVLCCVKEKCSPKQKSDCSVLCRPSSVFRPLTSVFCPLWFWLARWVCRVFCILFFRLCVYGKENVPDKGAFVLVGNHQSYLDPIFCGIPLKRHLYFLARDSLFTPLETRKKSLIGFSYRTGRLGPLTGFTNRFFRWLLSSVNTIPVKGDIADLSAMKTIIGKVRGGSGVCLFPEATRTSDGKIAPFKRGFSLICRRAEAAVVPVVVDGAFECWPRHKKMFSPGRIAVCYGKAITAEQVKGMNDRELAANLTVLLRRMQNDCRVKHGKEPYDYSIQEEIAR